MIGLFVKLALLVAAAHSSCHNRKQKARCKALQQRKADTEHQVSAVRERNEKFDAEHKNDLKRRDSAWRKRMSRLHCDALRQHDELCAQVAHVEGQVQRVRRQLRVNGSFAEALERAARKARRQSMCSNKAIVDYSANRLIAPATCARHV
eukprot:TRINITY_DN1089_c0_g1_i3.p1 TRINITY_DN1089_c0_g1~~TRINITY_DN1089_c0_g1_i3.p1  ORF type:complete len:150 (+),score=31.18 TRINITY_DN1089_c0_g1_i3:791-1240(+)